MATRIARIKGSASIRATAASPGGGPTSELAAVSRRYAWQTANAAYSVTDEQINKLAALGLSDEERLDIALITSIFSAPSIIEPLSIAVAPAVSAREAC